MIKEEIEMKKITIPLLALVVSAWLSCFAVTNDVSVGSGAITTGPKLMWLTLPQVSLATTAATSGDFYTVMTIPAGTVVHGVWYKASTAAGAACTISVGDTANSSSNFVYQGSINTTTAALAASADVSAVYYVSADKLRVLVNDSNSTAVFTLKVLVSKP
jgi:hypothetical protein